MLLRELYACSAIKLDLLKYNLKTCNRQSLILGYILNVIFVWSVMVVCGCTGSAYRVFSCIQC